MTKKCFFCDAKCLDDGQIFAETNNFYARWDDIPVTRGHCELVPKEHIGSLFSLSSDLAGELFGLVQQVKVLIDSEHSPDGYNLGVNEGEAAGRTQHHLHVHLIPRYFGDVENPRGGIRNIIPGKGNYDDWMREHDRDDYLDD
ncbi:HIT family protein [Candidatus Woesearchaeota archaeon]|nr:HIT family protein [Candidatus Woesearchaeota archaeon]